MRRTRVLGMLRTGKQVHFLPSGFKMRRYNRHTDFKDTGDFFSIDVSRPGFVWIETEELAGEFAKKLEDITRAASWGTPCPVVCTVQPVSGMESLRPGRGIYLVEWHPSR